MGIIYRESEGDDRGESRSMEQIAELTAKIRELPKGYISKKTIGGKAYDYHQWSEGGVKQSRYLRDDEVEHLAGQMKARKELQVRLRSLKASFCLPLEREKRKYEMR